jgi:hypothetical protein
MPGSGAGAGRTTRRAAIASAWKANCQGSQKPSPVSLRVALLPGGVEALSLPRRKRKWAPPSDRPTCRRPVAWTARAAASPLLLHGCRSGAEADRAPTDARSSSAAALTATPTISPSSCWRSASVTRVSRECRSRSEAPLSGGTSGSLETAVQACSNGRSLPPDANRLVRWESASSLGQGVWVCARAARLAESYSGLTGGRRGRRLASELGIGARDAPLEHERASARLSAGTVCREHMDAMGHDRGALSRRETRMAGDPSSIAPAVAEARKPLAYGSGDPAGVARPHSCHRARCLAFACASINVMTLLPPVSMCTCS